MSKDIEGDRATIERLEAEAGALRKELAIAKDALRRVFDDSGCCPVCDCHEHEVGCALARTP